MTSPDTQQGPGEQPPLPAARLRRGRGLALVWLVPIAALALVIYLGVRTLWQRGPMVTITFDTADGLDSGRTKVRHKDVEIGTVENVTLSDDMKHVVVTARMNRDVAAHVDASAKFWIVRPRFSAAGISGLNTLVSGAYIEMEPGAGGDATTEFKGLEEPPLEEPVQAGKHFTLNSAQLGSLGQGSPIYYRGVVVGEVLASSLKPQGEGIRIDAYVRSPYDAFVHASTRFWNASGISISAGPQGVKASIASLQALVSGGIGFETPSGTESTPISAGGAEFHLFDDESSARAEPVGPPVMFQVNFPGVVRGLGTGAGVELKGVAIGQVLDMHIAYDAKTGTLSTPTTFAIDPYRLGLENAPKPSDGNYSGIVQDEIGHLVAGGLRARLATASLLTGQRVVSLEMTDDEPPAKVITGGLYPEIPAVDSGDLDSLTHAATQTMRSIKPLIEHIDKLVTGPEVKHSLQSLDRTLANVDHLTATDLPALVKSLHETADSAKQTLDTANRALGGGGQRDSDLQNMLHELSEAARSVRSLADFLEEHPEALLQGKSGASQ